MEFLTSKMSKDAVYLIESLINTELIINSLPSMESRFCDSELHRDESKVIDTNV